jgi:superfamily I DNA/RNA helicase
VRRILDFGSWYPGARRVQLATNYRCPPAVVGASLDMVSANLERYAKEIRPAPGRPAIAGEIVAMPTADSGWPERVAAVATASTERTGRCCILARTRAELGPVALALLRAGTRHACNVATPLDAEPVRALLERARSLPGEAAPFPALLKLRAVSTWRRGDADDALGDGDHASLDALLGWAAAFPRLDRLLAAVEQGAERLAALRDPEAPLELVTVHGAKGREWPVVIVIGFEEERFPNRRALIGAKDPARAIEEERRLAYVAITRATQRLILAFDPDRPSRFLEEMGYSPTSGAISVR